MTAKYTPIEQVAADYRVTTRRLKRAIQGPGHPGAEARPRYQL
jgi:hypothetical protein